MMTYAVSPMRRARTVTAVTPVCVKGKCPTCEMLAESIESWLKSQEMMPEIIDIMAEFLKSIENMG